MSQSDEKQPDLAPERVEIGMEIAFGAQGESVLDALERLTGVRSRIILHDPAEDDSPVVRVPGEGEADVPEHSRRYEVLGEIARGGVGVILKSRDRDLGRDVALKVLRKDLAQVPEVVQRFVEEAQIEGQLQHPGVVPVYGLGVQQDGRPYFAMKLVKGKTLAALIRDGKESDRSRFLSIFERVCQTVAYAHARKVIHRDLKPANVLVGNFGETQVVDWGFAKVLGQGGVADEHREEQAPELSVIQTIRSEGEGSTSQVGSIMGTPGYMPPEQARGDIEKLDERADVFSLGAVLTEILTGKPPYTGTVKEQILAAAGAKLDDTKARLAMSGADPELVHLAERCLSPARDARPRHSGEVAEAVTEYLASLDEKKREAELRAASMQRTRRLTIALAGAILLAVVLGGGGLFLADRAKRDRVESANAAVNTALRDAGVLLGEARAADVEDLTHWPAIRKQAGDAVALAGDLGADEEIAGSADAFLARVREEESAARRKAAVAAEDRKLSAILWDIRLWEKPLTIPADLPHLHEGIPGYREALLKFGLDMDAASVEEAANWIRGRTILPQLVEVMDDWVHRLRDESQDATRLLKVFEIVDPDPLRGRIRAACAEADLGALKALRAESSSKELPSETLRCLAEGLGLAGDPAAAVDLYRVVSEREPYDFGISARLAAWLMKRPPSATQEAISLLSRAAALRKDSVAVRQLLVLLYRGSRMLDAELNAAREVYALAPEAGRKGLLIALLKRGSLYRNTGNFEAAGDAFREATTIDGQNPHIWAGLAAVLSMAGHAVEAEEAAFRALDLDPDHPFAHAALGDSLRCRNKRTNALASYDRAIGIRPGVSPFWMGKGKALGGLGRLEEAIECWKEAARLQPGYFEFPQFVGLAYLKLGQTKEAIEALREACRLKPDWATGHGFLALAYLEAGERTSARKSLDRSIEVACRAVNSPTPAVMGDLQAQVGLVLGRRFGPEAAVAFWEKRFPNAAAKSRASFLLGLANVVLNVRLDPEAARRICEEAIRIDPTGYRGHQELGFLLGKIGDQEGALACHRKAVEVSDGAGNSIYWLQRTLEIFGRYREVVEFTRRRIEANPALRKALELYERHLDLQERVEEIRNGSLQPSDAGDCQLFGSVLLHAGYLADAYSFMLRHIEEREPWTDRRTELEYLAQNHQFAARIAALASAESEGDEAREWRNKAQRQLGTWMALMEEKARFMYFQDEGPDLAAGELAGLLLQPVWAFIRDDAEVAKLPEEEQAACRDVWTRIRALVEKVP